MPTHYETLGIDKNATDSEIKKAYRALSLKYHPDRNSSEEAKTLIQQVNAAYEVLSDKDAKQKYDNELNGIGQTSHTNMHANMHANMRTNFMDVDSMFNMMFNGMPLHPGMGNFQTFRNGNTTTHVFTSSTSNMKPALLTKYIDVTLEQAYSGCSIPVEIQRVVQVNGMQTHEVENIRVDVLPGVNDNENIVIQNIGNRNNDIKGDVNIVIKIKNDTPFKRSNLDLIYDKTISLKEALCGFTFEFIHVSGKKLSMNNTNPITIITPGYKQVIQGYGMKKDTHTGNMIFNFNIEFPNELSQEQRTHISNGLP
jgi:DnaJ-class molecular chaperone